MRFTFGEPSVTSLLISIKEVLFCSMPTISSATSSISSSSSLVIEISTALEANPLPSEKDQLADGSCSIRGRMSVLSSSALIVCSVISGRFIVIVPLLLEEERRVEILSKLPSGSVSLIRSFISNSSSRVTSLTVPSFNSRLRDMESSLVIAGIMDKLRELMDRQKKISRRTRKIMKRALCEST